MSEYRSLSGIPTLASKGVGKARVSRNRHGDFDVGLRAAGEVCGCGGEHRWLQYATFLSLTVLDFILFQ